MKTKSLPRCECCLTEFKEEYRSNMSVITAITSGNKFCFSLCLTCYSRIAAKMSDAMASIRHEGPHLKMPTQYTRR